MFEALVSELAVERNNRVADHVGKNHVGAAVLDLLDHGAPLGMAQLKIFVGNPLGAGLFDQDLADLGHLARVDIVRPDDEKLLLIEVFDDPGDVVAELLIGNGAGVDDVLRALEPFIVSRIEVKVLALLEDRQHGFSAGRRVGAEYGGNPVLNDQLVGFFVVGLGIACAVFEDRRDLLAQHAALGVDFRDRHEGRIRKRFLDDRQAAGQ